MSTFLGSAPFVSRCTCNVISLPWQRRQVIGKPQGVDFGADRLVVHAEAILSPTSMPLLCRRVGDDRRDLADVHRQAQRAEGLGASLMVTGCFGSPWRSTPSSTVFARSRHQCRRTRDSSTPSPSKETILSPGSNGWSASAADVPAIVIELMDRGLGDVEAQRWRGADHPPAGRRVRRHQQFKCRAVRMHAGELNVLDENEIAR